MKMIHRRRLAFALRGLPLVLILLAHPAAAALDVAVGDGTDCDFADLQSAIDATLDADEAKIRLTGPQLADVSVTVSPLRPLTIEGGYADCSATEPTDETALLGNFSERVIDADVARGSELIIRRVVLLQGSAVEGGGLRIRGGGRVILEHAVVNGNDAERGGGIALDGGTLVLSSSSVSGNRVVSHATDDVEGGGVHCKGGGRVELRRASRVLANTAFDGIGGGLYLDEGCHLEVSSDRFDLPSGIENNQASTGGGVYAQGGSTLVLEGDDHTPVVVRGNRAVPLPEPFTAFGGGILVAGQDTTLLLQDALLEDNIAREGIGGGLAVFARARATVTRTLAPQACHTADRCSRIAGNQAAQGAAAAVNGDESVLEVARTFVEDNVGFDSVFDGFNGGRVLLDGSVLGNNEALHLVHLEENAAGKVLFTTVAGNDLTGGGVFSLVGGAVFDLVASIVFEPDIDVIAEVDAGAIDARCVLSVEVESLAGGREIELGIPVFVNAPTDMHLTEASEAVDFCTPELVGEASPDLDLGRRGVDSPRANRSEGAVFDLGADELGVIEALFGDRFESASDAG